MKRYRGVERHSARFRARIRRDGALIELGSFLTLEDARDAYLAAASTMQAPTITRQRPHWTEDQINTARHLLNSGAGDDECMAAVGRNRLACYMKIDRLRYNSTVKCEKRIAAPTQVFVEADRRTRTPRTITAWLCGDPAPGYSALDRKMGA